jgi:Pectate lyase superfamily protein
MSSKSFQNADKLEGVVSVTQFGAVGDGATDDTAAIQAAINFASANNLGAEVFFPQGIYRTTSVINITGAVTICGVYSRAEKLNTTPRGGGSWFYLDHSGKGFSLITQGGTVLGDVYFSKIGTYRNQPAPGSGWAPNSHDYDFWLQGAQDVTWDDVILLNPTKGISSTGSGGRLNFYKLRGQPFQVGIYIDKAYDVCRFDQIHFWQFWSQDTNVVAYTQANLNAINLLRCDNPMLSNFFVYGALNGLLISQGSNGTVSKLHLVNADFDGTATGVNIDSSVVGTTLQVENITHLGSPLANSRMAYIQGSSSNVYFGSARTTGCSKEAIRVSGASNAVNIGESVVDTWATAGGAVNAFYVSSTSRINFAIPPLLGTNGGTGTPFNSGGQISSGRWIDWTPSVSSSSGALSAYTSSGKYKIQDQTVYYQIEINITNNGTGSGFINSTLPYSTPLVSSAGTGRETSISGKALTSTLTASQSSMQILNYDNSYPAVNGCRFVLTGSYIVGTV